MKLKHKQNIENKEHNFKKKTFVGEIFDGINKKNKLNQKKR